MKIIRTLVWLAAADVLSAFIAFTLAASGSGIMKAVSAVCTVGILCCLMAGLAVRTASTDMKQERLSGSAAALREPLSMGIAACAPGVLSWVMLCISRSRFPEYYRWHKLINCFFLQIYNFISPAVGSSALTTGQLAVMGVLTLVPGAVFMLFYTLARRGVFFGD